MRLIGQLDSKAHAERFLAYLTTQEISAHCEHENDGWEIWVRDEDQIDRAIELYHEFKADPASGKYREAVDKALTIAREQERKAQKVKKNMVQMQSRWNAPITRRAPLTIGLVVVCVIISLLTNFGRDIAGTSFRALALGALTSEQATELVGSEGLHEYNTRLRLGSLLHGELWRLITPIFLHFGPWHLLFNMYWLVVFGAQIEGRYGAVWMALIVVMTAIPANVSGALAPANLDGVAIANLGGHWVVLLGGFSGVIYGLFGYIWMKMVFDPQSGLFITRTTATVLMVWLLICMMPGFTEMTGINIANWAHGIGLVAGLIIGYTPKLMADLGIGRSRPPQA